MTATLCLDLVPAAEPLAGLRVVQDGGGRVDRVLSFDVPALRGPPVLFPGGENFLYVFKPGRHGPGRAAAISGQRSLPLRSASAPGGSRVTRVSKAWVEPAVGRVLVWWSSLKIKSSARRWAGLRDSPNGLTPRRVVGLVTRCPVGLLTATASRQGGQASQRTRQSPGRSPPWRDAANGLRQADGTARGYPYAAGSTQRLTFYFHQTIRPNPTR
jgi:hypothetical protein